MGYYILITAILLYLVIISKSSDECPKKCTCKHSLQRDGPDWIKVRCGDSVPVTHLEELDLLNIASEVVQLNLSRNQLTAFTPKIQFLALQKLDISKNQLTVLYNNQFIEVPNLRRLDISGNNIRRIEPLTFTGLHHLERLKLNHNQISTIEKGTFKSLSAIKQLDISNNPLTCDCDLLWLLGWAQKLSVKLISNPKCNSPPTFKGIPLRKLQIGIDIHCKSPAGNRELPIIELLPNQSQVVFEGDSLELTCKAPSITDAFEAGDAQINSYIEWSWLDSDPKNHFDDIEISNRYSADSGLLISSLKFSSLNHNHTGIWNCRLSSSQGNYSQGLMIIVISDDTKYCPIINTIDNKGSYMWPRTIVNYTVSLPCESVQLNRDISEQKATHFCSSSGDWINLNTSECTYVSETTKILEQFSKVNLSLTKGSIYESAKHFKNYTSNFKIFKDIMDLVFTVRTIENYMHYLSDEKELGVILMDVLNNLIEVPRLYLDKVDSVYNVTMKLIKFSEKIAGFATAPVLHKSNIAVEEFPVKQEVFAGMTCTWYVNPINNSDRLFYCITSNRPVLSGMQDRIVEASIQIPASLFYQLQEQDITLNQSMQRLFVGMFSSSKFFPIIDFANHYVTSAVVGVKLVNIPVTNLTEPIYVMLRPPPRLTFESTSTLPVWWNASMNNGKGNWSTDGCELSHEVQDNLVFHCKQLGYYGLLQNMSYSSVIKIGAKFRLSHPAIYVGSFALFLSLFIVILTYCICYMSIQMPKKAKHSLVNMWIAVVLLIFVYVFGIYQTEDFQLCQIIGLMLHYFTLCSLFWMCVGVTTMYKRLNKNDNAIELQDDELPSDQPVQKPILGLYLIGWGVALIVCGISGAVNMKEYASHTHCFLSTTPALSALFIPAVVLLLILSALFLLIRCTIYSSDANGHLSEGTQVTENVDLDMLEPSFPNPDHTSVRSSSTKTRSSEVEDAEHAPSTQLKAYIIFLIIYFFAWFSCALATVKPFKFQFEEDVFSIVYAIFATALGAFTLFFYCVARNDIRTQWLFLQNCIKKKGICFRSRNVSDATQNIPQIQIQPLPLQPGGNSAAPELHVTSRSSSRSSSHTKSNSNNSNNVLKAAVSLNGTTMEEPHGARINNVNLVVLHRQQYRTNNTIPNLIEHPASSAQVFYNPYQSTVARRFFKRQRQHMMKRNNLTMRKCVANSDSASIVSSKGITDHNIFGTNSKVNNTNIHVEHVRKTKQRNPNVLSDSHEEINLNNVPLEKLMMNAERLRKRELNRPRPKKKQNISIDNKEIIEENNMRTVSQQCSLEYSSDSTSILEKSLSLDKPAQGNTNCESESSPSVGGETLAGKSRHHKSNGRDSQKLYKNNKIGTDCEPSDLSLSIVNSTVSELSETVPRIYVNPSHDLLFPKRVQSRASSVSTSELDELYQQIRRGRSESSHKFLDDFNILFQSRNYRPRLSDPEISLNVSNLRHRSHTSCSIDNISDNVETVV